MPALRDAANSRIWPAMQLLTCCGRAWEILVSPTVWATLAVAAAQGTDVLVRALGGRVITRQIGPDLYGQLSTVGALLAVAELLSRGGLFTSSAVYLVRTKEGHLRQALGAVGALALIRGLLLAVCLLPIAAIVGRWYGSQIGDAMLATLPLAALIPCYAIVPTAASAVGHTRLLACSKLAGSVCWLFLGMSVVYGLGPRLPMLAAGQQLAQCLILPVAWLVLRPSFSRLADHVAAIVRLVRSYGAHQYLAQLVDQGAEQLMMLLVPFLTSAREFGYFCLAGTLAMPVSLLSGSLLLARFRRVAEAGSVPWKYVAANLASVGLGAAAVLSLQSFIVDLILGPEFNAVTRLVPALVLAEVFRGAYQPYLAAISGWADPRFKYTSFIAGAATIAVYPSLIWFYGLAGAVTARVALMALWLVLVYGFYRLAGPPAGAGKLRLAEPSSLGDQTR